MFSDHRRARMKNQTTEEHSKRNCSNEQCDLDGDAVLLHRTASVSDPPEPDELSPGILASTAPAADTASTKTRPGRHCLCAARSTRHRARGAIAALLQIAVRLTAWTILARRRRRVVVETFRAFSHDAAPDEAFERTQRRLIFRGDEADRVAHRVRAAGSADAMDVIF